MQERQNIAVFVDYDNIEIGVKSTLRREFAVSLCLDALKERGDIVAKFAYANWSRQEGAVRQMAENAVQMVQRLPSPRGDKNGADINLALDALEMAFTHKNVNSFAIISGDSDFIPLVNKLKAYGKTIYIVGGKAFTSTILQQNCHEFISYESLLDDSKYPPREGQAPRPTPIPSATALLAASAGVVPPASTQPQPHGEGHRRGRDHRRPAPLDLPHALPLVERALATLRRRGVQPQLGLLKSTMLQLDPSFNERAYGTGSFSDFVDKLESNGYLATTGPEGRKTIEVKPAAEAVITPKKEEALPLLREVVDYYKLDLEDGVTADALSAWVVERHPQFDAQKYGFQSFSEFLNFAQDNFLVRVEADAARGLIAYPAAEIAPAPPAPDIEVPAVAAAAAAEGHTEIVPEAEPAAEEEPVTIAALAAEPQEDEKPKRAPARKRTAAKKTAAASGSTTVRRPRARKPVE
ncbi:MAG TPA: NYN domain-containing protein [Bryobacteraceae bacterium]|nr:NYN domain-containing protein [Bryobacteraceae bacterium]